MLHFKPALAKKNINEIKSIHPAYVRIVGFTVITLWQLLSGVRLVHLDLLRFHDPYWMVVLYWVLQSLELMCYVCHLQPVAIAVGDWFFDRAHVKLIDCPYPCDNSCHNLVSRWAGILTSGFIQTIVGSSSHRPRPAAHWSHQWIWWCSIICNKKKKKKKAKVCLKGMLHHLFGKW